MEKIKDKPSLETNLKEVNEKEFGLTVLIGGKNKDTHVNRKSFYSVTKTEFDLEESSASYNKFKAKSNINNPITSALEDSSDIFNITSALKMGTTRKSEPPINGGGGGGGNDMEKRLDTLERKTEQIQDSLSNAVKSLAVIEESQKNGATKAGILELKNELITAIHGIETKITELTNTIPKEDNIKQIITTTTKEQKLTSESFVETKITKMANAQIKWMIVTALGIISAVVGILRLF